MKELEKDQVREIAEEKLGKTPNEISSISSGLVHQTFELIFEEQNLILQIADDEQKRIWALERKCEIFSCETDLPIPKLVVDIQKVDVGNKERSFYIAEKLPGEILQKSFQDGIAREIGQKLAEVHKLKSFEKPGWLGRSENGFKIFDFEEGSLTDWMIKKNHEDIEFLKKNGFGEVAEESGQIMKKNQNILQSDYNPVLCHNDYSPSNILAEDGEITGIIDFDYVYAGPKTRDLVKSANQFWMEGLEIREEIYDGYRSKNKLPANFEKLEAIYRLETLIRITKSLIELKEQVPQEEKEEAERKIQKTLKYSKNTLD